jgi:hypothetical protein
VSLIGLVDDQQRSHRRILYAITRVSSIRADHLEAGTASIRRTRPCRADGRDAHIHDGVENGTASGVGGDPWQVDLVVIAELVCARLISWPSGFRSCA